MNQTRIPKIIHYCWFGRKEKPADVVCCIDTWQQHLSGYRIMEWNEDNFCVDDAPDYVREAYACQKWAFVSDYVRLHALCLHGGIYLDTDVEVFRSFDDLLDNTAFFGFESNDYLSTAVMGGVKQAPVFQEFLEQYKTRHFILPDGTQDIVTTNVVALTRLLMGHGLQRSGKAQTVAGCRIYPQWYFSANDLINLFGKYRKGSFAYHHYSASWYERQSRNSFAKKLRHYVLGIARNTIGTKTLYRMRHG